MNETDRIDKFDKTLKLTNYKTCAVNEFVINRDQPPDKSTIRHSLSRISLSFHLMQTRSQFAAKAVVPSRIYEIVHGTR